MNPGYNTIGIKMKVKLKQSLSYKYSSRRMVNVDAKSEHTRGLREGACDYTPTLITPYVA